MSPHKPRVYARLFRFNSLCHDMTTLRCRHRMLKQRYMACQFTSIPRGHSSKRRPSTALDARATSPLGIARYKLCTKSPKGLHHNTSHSSSLPSIPFPLTIMSSLRTSIVWDRNAVTQAKTVVLCMHPSSPYTNARKANQSHEISPSLSSF